MLFETPYEEIKYLKQFLEIDNQVPAIFYDLGIAYNHLYQYDKAIPEFVKALDIYKKWDSKPMWVPNYTNLGRAYHETRQYKKERKLYSKAEKDFPEVPILIYRQAVLSLTVRDMNAANYYIEKYISLCKERSASEADIVTSLAGIYSEAGIQDKAEDLYRKALSLQPESPSRLNDLAWYLIDKDRDINEGLDLIDKALILSPDDYLIIDTKGWGLYKQGKFKEALEVLQEADSLKPIYSHEIYLHLEAAKKAVANQTNN
jgi:tetratricopeptide (TPR) repeat protein